MESGQILMYRGCTPVVDRHVDMDGDTSLAVAIVEAIADAAGVEPTDLPPIYDSINADALDGLSLAGADDAELVIGFVVDDWNVFVSHAGHIRVCDATEPTPEPEPVFA